MFSYDEFKSMVQSEGFARTNRFFIQLSPPAIEGATAELLTGSGQNSRNLHMLCQSVSIPGVNVTTDEVRTTGEVINAPYDRNFGDATFTFYVDQKLYVRRYFDEWIENIQNPYTRMLKYHDEFAAPALTVVVLDMKNDHCYMISLNEVFPKSIGVLSVGSENNNIMTLDVTFSYRNYITYTLAPGQILSYASALAGTTFATDTVVQDPLAFLKSSKYSNVLDGYFNDLNGFVGKVNDSLGVLNDFGIKIESNIPQVVSNKIQQSVRGAVNGTIQKAFGGKLNVYF